MNAFFQTLHHADQAATLWLNSINCPVSDVVWMVFSNTPIWFIFYAAVAVVLFRRLGWKKGLVSIVALALTVVLCDQSSNLLKYSVCRLRPCHDPWMLASGLNVLENGGLFGFFSAHAANTFGFAMCSSKCLSTDAGRSHRAYTVGVFIWASLVSVSRVFVGKHFIGDILVGTVVGLLFGFLTWKLAEAFFKKITTTPNKNA